jgi:hypothetical protein
LPESPHTFALPSTSMESWMHQFVTRPEGTAVVIEDDDMVGPGV